MLVRACTHMCTWLLSHQHFTKGPFLSSLMMHFQIYPLWRAFSKSPIFSVGKFGRNAQPDEWSCIFQFIWITACCSVDGAWGCIMITVYILMWCFCCVERYVPPHLRNRQGPPPGRGVYPDQVQFNPAPRDFGPRDPYRGLLGLP